MSKTDPSNGKDYVNEFVDTVTDISTGQKSESDFDPEMIMTIAESVYLSGLLIERLKQIKAGNQPELVDAVRWYIRNLTAGLELVSQEYEDNAHVVGTFGGSLATGATLAGVGALFKVTTGALVAIAGGMTGLGLVGLACVGLYVYRSKRDKRSVDKDVRNLELLHEAIHEIK